MTGKIQAAEGCPEQKVPGSRHGRSVDTGKGTGHIRLFEGGILIVGMPWCAKGDAKKEG